MSRPAGTAGSRPVSPGLRARLGVTRGRFRLDLELAVTPGEVLALVGPNGAGKTTALRALAGLGALDDGVVTLDGQPLDDPAAGVYVAAARRPVGLVPQDALLFPHLSALDNVAFGLRARGLDRRAARVQAREWLAGMGLVDHAQDRPRALSGGQAQRVALARALAPAPRLLLLDEPLAALDAVTRLAVRTELRATLTAYGGCTVLVTHDMIDAMVLADRLVVVEEGRAVQAGTPAEVARAPRSRFAARFVGLNLLRGTVEQGGDAQPRDPRRDHARMVADGEVAGSGVHVRLDDGGALVATAADHVVDLGSHGGAVLVAFAPAAVALYRSRPEGSPRNAWPVRVRTLEPAGDIVRVGLGGPPDAVAEVTALAVAELGLTPGTALWAVLKATEARVYPA